MEQLVEELTAQINATEKRIRARIAELDAEREALVALLPSTARVRGKTQQTRFAVVAECLSTGPKAVHEMAEYAAAKLGGSPNRYTGSVRALIQSGRLEVVGNGPRATGYGRTNVNTYALATVS